ncbi:MAG: class I SAM-dependent methyltransferase, partial [Anaerolineae bacterium]|nr:class I SAM-dependent methyltransferase [Anaerolineae bacterium]
TVRMVSTLHDKHVFQRRIQALARAIGPKLESGHVLDVGCGNGQLAALIMTQRDDVDIVGIDVHLRPESYVPVAHYDGEHIPYDAGMFSSVMIVDVLHHTDDPVNVLRECLRVSRGGIVVKDHFFSNPLDRLLLRGMDWVGNAPHGVRLPYRYFTRTSWAQALESAGAHEVMREEVVSNLYPQPFQSLIGRRIQFVAQLGH